MIYTTLVRHFTLSKHHRIQIRCLIEGPNCTPSQFLQFFSRLERHKNDNYYSIYNILVTSP